MNDKRFNIIFKGEIVGGADEATVRTNVAKLFKANDKVLARLFSGDPIAIKKDVDKAGAMKYRALMKKAGAICYAQDPSAPLETAGAAQSKQTQTGAVAQPNQRPSESTKSGSPNPVNADAPSDEAWSLAPTGSVLVEPKAIEGVDIPDIDSITLSPVGADVLENQEPVSFEELPDVSGIDLAPVGADVADPVEQEVIEIPDVETIDLAPVGADVADPVEKDEPPPPDVSNISLAPVGADVADPEPEKPEPDVDISHIKLDQGA